MSSDRPTPSSGEISRLLSDTMRRDGPRLVAQLTRLFGARRLSLAEDVVQDAALAALIAWQKGLPDNPGGWLAATARNRALDHSRRNAVLAAIEPDILRWTEELTGDMRSTMDHAGTLGDDELSLLFLCAHPALAPESQLALVLKTVCGLEVDEIARAFLTTSDAIAQRLVRAKARLREINASFDMPTGAERETRRAIVMRAIYLLFNEAYAASGGASLLRDDLAREALRLARALATHPGTQGPEPHALVALIAFHYARARARMDNEGALIFLEDQDRSKWDRALIAEATTHLRASMGASHLSTYNVEAGIAACHALAPSFDKTDWSEIAGWYAMLIDMAPSPIAKLNHAVAIAMRDGAPAGYALACSLQDEQALADYAPFHATLGELARRAGNAANASLHFSRALECACALPMRNAIIQRHSRLQGSTL